VATCRLRCLVPPLTSRLDGHAAGENFGSCASRVNCENRQILNVEQVITYPHPLTNSPPLPSPSTPLPLTPPPPHPLPPTTPLPTPHHTPFRFLHPSFIHPLPTDLRPPPFLCTLHSRASESAPDGSCRRFGLCASPPPAAWRSPSRIRNSSGRRPTVQHSTMAEPFGTSVGKITLHRAGDRYR